jgi:hypothetical protein
LQQLDIVIDKENGGQEAGFYTSCLHLGLDFLGVGAGPTYPAAKRKGRKREKGQGKREKGQGTREKGAQSGDIGNTVVRGHR